MGNSSSQEPASQQVGRRLVHEDGTVWIEALEPSEGCSDQQLREICSGPGMSVCRSVIVLGSDGVGKSTLIQRMLDSPEPQPGPCSMNQLLLRVHQGSPTSVYLPQFRAFLSSQLRCTRIPKIPRGVLHLIHQFVVNGSDVVSPPFSCSCPVLQLSLIDGIGHASFRHLKDVSLGFKVSNFVLMYDVNDQTSFLRAIDHWVPAIRDVETKARVLLLGNKVDREQHAREVTAAEGASQAIRQVDLVDTFHDVQYFETSALTNQNVNEVLCYLACAVLNENV